MNRAFRAVQTLVKVDPEFSALCKSLYGEVDAELIYEDVFGKGVSVPKVEEMAEGAYQAQKLTLPKFLQGDKAYNAGRALNKPLEHKKLTGAFVATAGTSHARGKSVGRKQGYEDALYGKGDEPKTLKRVGIGATVVGGALGVKELGEASAQLGHEGLHQKLLATGKTIDKIPGGSQVKNVIKNPKVRLGLVGGMLGGDIVATGMQARKPKAFSKAEVIEKPLPDLELMGTFSKFDDEKKQAFGYASVVKKDGLPVIDRQGDYIDAEEMEKAAYEYVKKSRIGGDMHKRQRDEYGIDRAHHVSDLIESMVFTPEKCQAMGLPDEVAKRLEGHWWVGYQIHDDDTWEQVRKQGRTGFSVHGRGKRVETTLDEVIERVTAAS